MILTDNKIINAVVESLSINDLEQLIASKKSVNKPNELTPKEKYKIGFEKWFKKKLFASIYK